MKKSGSSVNDDAANDPCLALQEIIVVDPANSDMSNNDKVVNNVQPVDSNDVQPVDSNDVQPVDSNEAPSPKSIKSNFVLTTRQRIHQFDYFFIRRILGAIIVIILASICLVHLVDRVTYYWNDPTSFQISVDRLHNVKFPAITICPSRKPFQGDSWNQAFRLSNFSESSKANMSVEDVWKENEITEDDLIGITGVLFKCRIATYNALYSLRSVSIWLGYESSIQSLAEEVKLNCNENNVCNATDGVKLTLKGAVMDTIYGRCVTLSQGFPVKYRGDMTFWMLYLSPRSYGFEIDVLGSPSAAMFLLHDPEAVYRNELIYLLDSWNPAKQTQIMLDLKQYEFQNSPRHPCYSTQDVRECKNKCMDDKLNQVISCSLPFMKSKMQPCKVVQDAKRAYDQAIMVFSEYDWAECICKRPCQETVYNINKQIVDEATNKTVMLIYFGDNLFETVYEEYAFSFVGLVSDVGGIVGIFLGLSFLSLFKMLDEYLLETAKKNE